MQRTLLHFSLAAALVYLGLCAWLYAAQDDMLYYPTPDVPVSEAGELRLKSGDAVLKIWRIGDGEQAVIYFGGNGEDVARNISDFSGLIPNSTVYLLNYRGYGGSSGTPGESAFFSDAAFLFDHLQTQHRNISVVGRSLGSGIGVWLAANRPVDKLVLVTPYDSIEDIASDVYPFIPVSLLLRDKYRSVDYVPNVTSPVLVLIAEVDNVVPIGNTMKLVDHLQNNQVSVHILENSNHQSISSAPGYFELIRQFLLVQEPASDHPDDTESTAALHNERPKSWMS